jgi:amino acid adenylation domain-containing protein
MVSTRPIATAELSAYFDNSARLFPDHTAIEEPGKGAINYRELAQLSDRLCNRLRMMGIQHGDRVGIYLHKSIEAVASILGILKCGAAYVPVDPIAPASRNASILNNCSVKTAITETCFAPDLIKESASIGSAPELIIIDHVEAGAGLARALEGPHEQQFSEAVKRAGGDDLAYILYTSGSTGKPKGVMLSHRNAVSFVDWCIETFQPRQDDRFSSHAPLHFDLSIFDLYVAFASGASLILIPEDIGKEPGKLANLIAASGITIWYSAPSILSLLVQYGSLNKYEYGSLRMVLFAGEVFPVKHLRALTEKLPKPRYFNLYGPTETNVCTFYEVPAKISQDRTEPFPIGKTCKHLRGRVLDENGCAVNTGERGELCIAGPAVMQGYWNLPEQSARAFWNSDGARWYRTGDIVTEVPDGNYIYVGRRDRMVKRRGYRVELGEIEAGLYRHSAIKEAAVVALSDAEAGVLIRAFISCREGTRPSIIEMKRFCMEVLPPYMIPDVFSFKESLPKTSTDKIDYQRLKESD